MPYNTYPYELPPLPYAYDALEPAIDAETMHYHHDEHFQTYITNLNDALRPYPQLQDKTLEQLLADPQLIPPEAYRAIMNNGGGVYNHSLFFQNLAPATTGNHMPTGILLEAINDTFGSFADFRRIFTQHAMDVFGSGWVCLVVDRDNKLRIVSLKDQDSVPEMGFQPIILFDVWEHAYYLKYKNRRDSYLNNIWNVIVFPSVG